MTYDSDDIRLLVAQLKQGNEGAFHALFDRYQKKLYYYVLRYTKSKPLAQDVVQEVFVGLWLKRECIDIQKDFTAFLFVMARNKVYDHLRKLAARNILLEEYARHHSQIYQRASDKLQVREYERLLEMLINELSAQKRNIYLLSRQQGKTNREIADLLGISPKTVKNHLCETMKTLKEQLRSLL